MKKALFLSVPCMFILFQTYAQPAYFTSDSPRCANDTMHFTPGPAGGIILMEVWDFGDGTTITYLPPAAFPVFATHVYASPGTYNVTRTVKFDTGTPSFSSIVQVMPHPVANFTHASITCAGQSVQFTDLSHTNGGSSIQSWSWDFGDPLSGTSNTSTLQNPSHLYSGAGTFTVTLTVTNANGCSGSHSNLVTINLLPVANFISTEACAGSPTEFTDLSVANAAGIISHSWNFGDGGTSNQPSPVHAYAYYGMYNATLTVVNSNGCTHSVTKQVLVKPNPVAYFSVSSANCIGSPVFFNDQSYIPAGFSSFITTWRWDFGDGTPVLVINFPENPSVSHTFAGTATAHVVRLTVTTSGGCSAYVEEVVSSAPAPIANFYPAGPTCDLQPVQFNDFSQTSGGTIVAYNWNFGDPLSGFLNTSTEQNPVHIFSAAGTFVVTLSVVNSTGCSDTISKAVPVNLHPFANFTADTASPGAPTTFTDLSAAFSGSIVNWLWDFGDGLLSTSSNPVHYYSTTGTFMARLTVTDINGCTKDTLKPVLVTAPVNNPPATQTIFNVIVGNGQEKCYNATQVITVAGGGTLFFVLPGGKATFIAGQEISFLPGTTVQAGGSMRGYIAPNGPYCVNPSMPSSVVSGESIPGSLGQSSLRVFPNPTTGTFNLEVFGPGPDTGVTVDVYGLVGEKVMTRLLDGEHKHQFSLTGMPAGLYLIRVTSRETSETVRILRQ